MNKIYPVSCTTKKLMSEQQPVHSSTISIGSYSGGCSFLLHQWQFPTHVYSNQQTQKF